MTALLILTACLLFATAKSVSSDTGAFTHVERPSLAPKPKTDWHRRYVRLWRYTHRLEGERNHYRRHLAARWRPTSLYAISLASRVSGVSYWQMRSVAFCESRFDPFATNGRYKGLFQLGWSPFGLSPYDPVANALSAALTVRHDGSWRQWSCKP